MSRLGASKTIIRRGCVVLAVISAALMWVLYNPLEDPTRVYYGTDTRACSLLIGAWLALFWPGQALTEEGTRNVPSRIINLLDVIGVIALVGIIGMMAFIDGFSGFMYHGGIIINSVLTAVLIAVLVHPRSRLARFASLKPFVWVGQRSYGIYLWHYPIILLMKPLNPGSSYAWWFILAVFVITFVVAALSYTFVENPIRHGAIGRAIANLARASRQARSRHHAPRVIAPALASHPHRRDRHRRLRDHSRRVPGPRRRHQEHGAFRGRGHAALRRRTAKLRSRKRCHRQRSGREQLPQGQTRPGSRRARRGRTSRAYTQPIAHW